MLNARPNSCNQCTSLANSGESGEESLYNELNLTKLDYISEDILK